MDIETVDMNGSHIITSDESIKLSWSEFEYNRIFDTWKFWMEFRRKTKYKIQIQIVATSSYPLIESKPNILMLNSLHIVEAYSIMILIDSSHWTGSISYLEAKWILSIIITY